MPPNFDLLFIPVKMLFMSSKVACCIENLVLKPYCSFARIENVVIWSISLLYPTFSISFGKEVSRDIGLQLDMFWSSPFCFEIGLIIVYFNLSGNMPVLSIITQIYVSGDAMYGALSFSICVEISSYPLVFLDFKDLIIFTIS
jgi:hypothetical protein